MKVDESVGGAPILEQAEEAVHLPRRLLRVIEETRRAMGVPAGVQVVWRHYRLEWMPGAAEDVAAPMSLPAFDNSAMDGYAVYFDDVASATDDHPVHLPVVGEMAAGQTKLFALSPGTAVRIMTGAPVPQGADTIIPVEATDGGVATVRINRAPTLHQHIRRQGEDVLVGDVPRIEREIAHRLEILRGIVRGR